MRRVIKLKNILLEQYPYLIMFCAYFFLNTATFHIFGDDNVYAAMSAQQLKDTYVNGIVEWSSRFIVNAMWFVVLYLVSNFSAWIFILVNSFMYVLLAYSLSKSVRELLGNNKEYRGVSIGVVAAFPISLMSSAGWIATSVSYLWPIAIGSWFWTKYLQSDKKTKKFSYILYGIALIIAVNLEGYSVLIGFALLGSLIYKVICKRRLEIKQIVYTLICWMMILYHMFSSGNESRVIQETINHFPDYNMLNFIDRVELGMTRLIYSLLLNYNWTFILLALFIFWRMYYTTSDLFLRCVSGIPLLLSFGINVLPKLGLFPALTSLISKVHTQGSVCVDNYSRLSSYIVLVIGMTVVISIIVSLVAIFSYDASHLCIAILIFLGGIASFMIMIFSPTIWASGDRPIMVFYVTCMALSLMIASRKDENEKAINTMTVYSLIIAMLSYLNELIMLA